jgi:hypothetical protein
MGTEFEFSPKRKLQTDEDKKTAALLASRANSLWRQALLSKLRALRDGNQSNEQGHKHQNHKHQGQKHQNQALLAIVALETELGKGHKLCKEVSLSLSLSLSIYLSIYLSIALSLYLSLSLSLSLARSFSLALSLARSLSFSGTQPGPKEGGLPDL